MGNLLNFAVYAPAILRDDDFLEGFVARQELTELLLKRLREITPKGVARHLLLIGQRGMGKTSMLRRLALGVEKDPGLSAILIPLTFREEQYNVHNLHVFWCNCLDALGDYLEKVGQHDQVVKLDKDVAEFESKGGDPDGNAAYSLFKGWCGKEGKRPLLFLDNIDLILGGLKEQQQWGLRRILQERGGVAIVGASSGFLEAVTKVDAPFYEFFQVHQLEKLSHSELLSCLRQIALKRGDAGKKVLQVLDSAPARIHTLYDLTGGNPRTLVLLYLLLELNAEGDVMEDLERLLDQVTPLYKARVEDLAPQTRVVVDAVALAWDPVTVAQVATETGIEATSISSQFDRLMKMGILEKVTLSTPAPVGYQLSERFFNIWYLMRNASRRLRNRLRWLTECLRRIYSPQQLSSLAEDFIRRHKEKSRCSGIYGMAFSSALEDKALCHALNHHVTRLFQELAETLCEQVEKFVDRSELDQTTLTMDEMKKRVMTCKRDWGTTSAEEYWDLLGGSIITCPRCKQKAVQKLDAEELEKVVSLVTKLRKEIIKLNKTIRLPDAVNCLRQALREGVVASASDLAHSRAAATNYGAPELILLMLCLADDEAVLQLSDDEILALRDNLRELFRDPSKKYNSVCHFNYGRFLMLTSSYDEAEIAICKAIELDPKNPYSWNCLSELLQYHLNRYVEAEAAYRKAIELDPNNVALWFNLGNLLIDPLKRYDEAEEAYRKAIDLDSMDADSWNNLGNLMHYHLNRYDEAETAYRKAIELDPNNVALWFNLGNLLVDPLKRYDEAEVAYRKAIELDSTDADSWNNLGNLLHYHLNRYDEAETAYRKAIDLDTNSALPWVNLGNLLRNPLKRYDEAEVAYRKAIDINPKDSFAWNCLGNLLRYQQSRYCEAEESFRKAIELNPNFALAWNCLGSLLQDELSCYDEAENAYHKAIELEPNDAYFWNCLGDLLQNQLSRYDEAENAYHKAIELEPNDAYFWNCLGDLLQNQLSRYDEAENAYHKAIELDPNDAYHWNCLGNLLQDHMSRYDDAEVAYRKAIELDEKDSDPWNDLGNLLMDHLGRIQEAEAAYRSAIELDLNDPYPKENFAYFLLSQPQRVEEAEKAYNEAFSLLPEHGKQLLTAFRALSRDNFGEASESIAKVLGENHPELYTEHYDDLLRILRLAKGRGYGDRLLAFLAESGLGERNWPLYAAFDAYLHGEAKLRNVNPEVRGAAQQIYDWLASNQKNAKQVEIAGEKGKRRK